MTAIQSPDNSELQARHWEQFSENLGLTKAQGEKAHFGVGKVTASHGTEAPI